jgi:predicted permease
LALMAVVGLILLIACTNLAGLLLARGATRQKEMSVRVALGAGRLRLMRHVFTEALVLSGLGSMLGVFFAYFGAGALVRMITSGRPIIGLPEPFDLPLRPDTHVLLFTGGIALLTGLLFGLAPAWNAFSLRGVSRSRVFGKALVVAQVGFSVLLLSAAGLFIGRLSDLRHSDLGFRRDHVLLVTLNASGSGYSPEALSHGYQDLLRRMEAIPGVRSATLCGASPLSGAGASGFANGVPRYVSISSVAPKYFETLGIPRLAGRDFNLQDQRVAIVSRAMARDYFPGSDPIGKQVTLEHVTGEREAKTYQIVGVVGDAHLYEISEAPNPTVYLPAFEDGKARASIEPESEAGVVRSLVSDVLKTVAVTRVTTLADQIDASIVPQRLLASLSGIFGALGSLLAAIGMYGLMAYTVARRIPEFGIRSALGATSNNLLFLVMREAMTLAAAGLLLGGLFASSLLRDAQVASVGSIGFGVLAMLGIALLAAILPARLAAHVEPMEALRHE